MRRSSRLLVVAVGVLLLAGLSTPASAQERSRRSPEKSQEEAAEADRLFEAQAVRPGGGTPGSSGLNVKGRFNCKCNSGQGVCAVIKKADTIECKPGLLSGCTSCVFATSTEDTLAPQ